MSNLFRNKFFTLLLIAIVVTTFVKQGSAAINFINGSNSSRITSQIYRSIPCVAEGYTLNRCIGNQTPIGLCPTDNRFFKSCICDPTVYKFNAYNCHYPKTLSGMSCDGKYEFCGCDAKFQYTKDNCPAPKVLSGMSCDGKYENCSCPPAYYKTCTGNMVGGSESCGGKFKSCKCASFYKVCSKGPDALASVCKEENGTVKYSQCFGNSCENGGYLASVPTNHKCSEVKYFENTCYKDCRPLTCFDGGYYDKNPSKNISCPQVEYGGKRCFDCDQVCGYCERFTGKCKIECKNDCKKGMWFENKLNGGFTCTIPQEWQ